MLVLIKVDIGKKYKQIISILWQIQNCNAAFGLGLNEKSGNDFFTTKYTKRLHKGHKVMFEKYIMRFFDFGVAFVGLTEICKTDDY